MSYSSELARFSGTKPSFTLLRCHQQSQIPFPSSPCFGTPLLQELPTERRCRLTTRWETPTRLSPVHKAETTKRHAQTRRKPVDRTVHSPSTSLLVEEGTGRLRKRLKDVPRRSLRVHQRSLGRRGQQRGKRRKDTRIWEVSSRCEAPNCCLP